MKLAAELSASALEGSLLAGRYDIGPCLGKGGMAYVYRATDRLLAREVAIKVLTDESSLHHTTVKRFAREARTLASIDSPFVVPLYDVGQDGGHTFFVMKLMMAPGLDSIITNSGALEPNRAVGLVLQVLEGLSSLHEKSLVHRDVKSANILVGSDGNAMLLDLGITYDPNASGLTADGIILGTPSYISPEQVAGTPIDNRSDLYSLGVVLFEATTGRLPFVGKNRVEVCLQHLRNPPPPPRSLAPGISPQLERALLKSLEKAPENRFQSAETMAKALRAALEEPLSSGGRKRKPAPPPVKEASQAGPGLEEVTTSRMLRAGGPLDAANKGRGLTLTNPLGSAEHGPSKRLVALVSVLLLAVLILVVATMFG